MRTYKREVGSRPYAMSYTPMTLEKALLSVRSGKMSIKKASSTYHVPFGTLFNKVNNKHSGKSGGQLRLSAETETRIVETIGLLS